MALAHSHQTFPSKCRRYRGNQDTEPTLTEWPHLNIPFLSLFCINWAICCLGLILSKTKIYL